MKIKTSEVTFLNDLHDEALDRPTSASAYCAACELSWGPALIDEEESLERQRS